MLSVQYENLEDFLWSLIGIRDKGYPPAYLAKQIQELDKNELCCHVEFPSSDNKLNTPCVWRIQDWKMSVERGERRSKAQAESNRKSIIEGEIRTKILKAIIRKTGGDEESNKLILDGLMKLKNPMIVKTMYNVEVSFEGL